MKCRAARSPRRDPIYRVRGGGEFIKCTLVRKDDDNNGKQHIA